MKGIVLKIICLLLLITLLVGCTINRLEELDIKHVDKNIKAFVVEHIGVNGAYLLQREGKSSVLLINNMNVEDSLVLKKIDEVSIETNNGVCTISYNIVPVEEAEKADDFKLYRFRMDETVDSIEIMKNNQQSAFKCIDIES